MQSEDNGADFDLKVGCLPLLAPRKAAPYTSAEVHFEKWDVIQNRGRSACDLFPGLWTRAQVQREVSREQVAVGDS